jgi:purine-binding chemotaxis protein CheW
MRASLLALKAINLINFRFRDACAHEYLPSSSCLPPPAFFHLLFANPTGKPMFPTSTLHDDATATSLVTKSYLVFSQGESLFGIELSALREVIPLAEPKITTVPNTLPLVMGLFNLRGEILAIADFGDMIGEAPTSQTSASSRIMVLEVPQSQFEIDLPIRFGLAVAQVAGVAPLQVDRISSAAEVGSKLTPLLQGLYNWQGRLLMLLDVRALADVLGASST